MKPNDKWLQEVKAYPSPEGWRHPKTKELLKAMRMDIEPEQSITETISVETITETSEEKSGDVQTTKSKQKKNVVKKVGDETALQDND